MGAVSYTHLDVYKRQVVQRIFEYILQLHKMNIEVYDYNIWIKSMNLLTAKKLDVCLSNGCNGGRRMITIDRHGDIYPCDVTDFPEEKMGNVSDDKKLIQLIKDAIKQNEYFKPKISDDCQICPWRYYCMGGCTVHMKCAGTVSYTHLLEFIRSGMIHREKTIHL